MNASAGRRLGHVGEMLEGEFYEIDSDGASKCSIRPGICNIALVVRQASFKIVIHVPLLPENSVTPPASLAVKVVGSSFTVSISAASNNRLSPRLYANANIYNCTNTRLHDAYHCLNSSDGVLA